VITDYQMPGMDGLAVLREIRRISPRIPVLVMSGRIDDSVQMQLREAGVTGFVEKPFGCEQIQQAISESLR